MGIDPKDVTCVVVTKNSKCDPLIWHHLSHYFNINSAVEFCNGYGIDRKVFGRYILDTPWAEDHDYEGIDRGCIGPIVYVQDDDCLVDIPEVLAHYEPGVVTCNIRHTHTSWYTDKLYNVAPVGWGAVFDRDLIEPAFSLYLSQYPKDDFFLRECDRIFTGLNRVKRVTAGCVNLPWAHYKDRMGNETRHAGDFGEAVRRVEGLMGLMKKEG